MGFSPRLLGSVLANMTGHLIGSEMQIKIVGTIGEDVMLPRYVSKISGDRKPWPGFPIDVEETGRNNYEKPVHSVNL